MKAFDNLADWQLGEHTCVHKPSGLKFWVANGWIFFDSIPRCMNLFQRWWYYRKFKKMIRSTL